MEIYDRLKYLRNEKEESQVAFATRFKLKQTTYSQYELGKREIPDDFKLKLSKQLGINLHWLITGEGEIEIGSGRAPQITGSTDISIRDQVPVKMLNLRVSAGRGEEWGDGVETGEMLYVPRDIALRYGVRHPEDLGGAVVRGDSMTPTLQDGEPVVFAKGTPETDGIYVLSVDGELLVKRLEFNRITGMLRIISDNPRYGVTEIRKEDLAARSVQVLGRVLLWIHCD